MHTNRNVRRPVVGVTADFDHAFTARLEEVADVKFGGWGVSGTVPTDEELLGFLDGVDIMIVAWENLTEEILEKSNLRFIASVRGGPGGNTDLAAAERLGIPVSGTIGREALPVAEFTFGMMIGLLRHISYTSHLMRTRDLTSFEPPPPGDIGWGMEPSDPWIKYRGEDLATKTLGLIGLGTVGRLVADRARAFEMTVIAYDPFVAEHEGVELVDLDTLMARADIVSVHARYSAETHHLIGEEHIGRMKPTAIFINTARPNIVDRAPLEAALLGGRIAGAAMDVHVKEPMDPNDPLLDLPNVVLTPHIAGSSAGVTRVQTEQVVENVRRFISGEPLVGVVNATTASWSDAPL